MSSHRFVSSGKCVWCGETPEKVADRRAPPFCVNRPEELLRRDLDEQQASANSVTGY